VFLHKVHEINYVEVMSLCPYIMSLTPPKFDDVWYWRSTLKVFKWV